MAKHKKSKMLAVILGFLLVPTCAGFVIPVCMIFYNLDYGKKVQQQLLDALKLEFPEITFDKGGVGYQGPGISIKVLNSVDDQTKNSIKRFLEKELDNKNIHVDIQLHFSADVKTYEFRKSSEPKRGWFNQ